VFLLCVILLPRGYKLKSIGYLFCMILPIFVAVQGYGANAKIFNPVSASKWIMLSFGGAVFLSLVFSLLLKLRMSTKVKWAGITSLAVIAGMFYLFTRERLLSRIMILIPQNILDRLLTIRPSEGTFIARVKMDQDAIKLIGDNWLFGLGGGGWTALYQSVQDELYIARSVHNHFLQIFVEAGILGFVSFTLLALLICFYFIRSLLKTESAKTKVYIAGVFCAYVTLSLHSIMDFNLSYSSLALLWWSFLSLSAIYYVNTKKESLFSLIKMSKWVYSAVCIVCITLIAVNSIYFLAARYEDIGMKYADGADIINAVKYYEKASVSDPANASYHAARAELYGRMAACSETEDEKVKWVEKQVTSAENSVRHNPNYPYYLNILVQSYFNSGRSKDALMTAERLIISQPLKDTNYELLARGCMEAGLQYLHEQDAVRAKELIVQCAGIIHLEHAAKSPANSFYSGKALLLLEKYQEAEEQLKKARNGSLSMKFDSDRLLYLINEMTGRSKDNVKYENLLWMGMVEKTPLYREVKEIINYKLLQ
jgi:tetratricopeptide (TPR) repeat protein